MNKPCAKDTKLGKKKEASIYFLGTSLEKKPAHVEEEIDVLELDQASHISQSRPPFSVLGFCESWGLFILGGMPRGFLGFSFLGKCNGVQGVKPAWLCVHWANTLLLFRWER